MSGPILHSRKHNQIKDKTSKLLIDGKIFQALTENEKAILPKYALTGNVFISW